MINISKKRIIKTETYQYLKILFLTFTSLCLLNGFAIGKTYTANLSGDFDEQTIWIPSFPGNIISESDTLYINNDVKLSSDVVVKGMVMVKREASLMGKKNLVVLQTGKFLNFGITIVDALSNTGMVYNKHILEVSHDFINSGELYNQENMVVGNIVDNNGLITGSGGNLIANKKFVNSQAGSIKGNIDVCSNNFMNVDGGTLDSTRVSFCGHRIFSNVFLSADVRKDQIELNIRNSENKNYKKYRVERSVDGINFETIATVNEKDEEEPSPFKYIDKDVLNSNSIFYRVRLTTQDDKETYIPTVEVGNLFSTRISKDF